MEAIGDYAIIGDGRSAALVSRRGSIDWLCWPQFDSPSLFGAILDDRAGGWSLRPEGPFRSRRRYRGATNVLETEFVTDSGRLIVTDFMPVSSEEEKERHLFPEHEILRYVQCAAGEVVVETAFEPRPGYARRPVRLGAPTALGLRLNIGAGVLTLRTEMPLKADETGRASGTVRLRAGDQLHFSLSYAHQWPAVLPPIGTWTRSALARSLDWWEGWARRMTYDGPHREAVLRSALALKLLVYAPSGAIVAAPTTSLPETVGGSLNWDYRYCWLRDASLTVRAFYGLGFPEEGDAFSNWLFHSTRLTRPKLQILYDVFGRQPRHEKTLPTFSGYRGSRPVRVGNLAAEQLQLDVYGEVLDALVQFLERGGRCDREARSLVRGFGRYVSGHWSEPDEGIWEPRSGRRRHTHSELLCWTALDRILELQARKHVAGLPVDALRCTREKIRKDLEQHAWNPHLNAYTAELGGDRMDASLLLLAWYGFEDAASPRMRSTYERIRKELGAGGALLYRYRTGESFGEGAFGIASFWGAEFLALGGGGENEAMRAFEDLLRCANDVGLFAEEIDPATREPLGNFPQAFTHVGLINTALTLERRLKGVPQDRARGPEAAA